MLSFFPSVFPLSNTENPSQYRNSRVPLFSCVSTMVHFDFWFLLFLLAAVVVKASRTRTIRVGFAGNAAFDPATTTADVGDVVVFEFFPTNHSVVRGEYAESEVCGSGGCNPCVP